MKETANFLPYEKLQEERDGTQNWNQTTQAFCEEAEIHGGRSDIWAVLCRHLLGLALLLSWLQNMSIISVLLVHTILLILLHAYKLKIPSSLDQQAQNTLFIRLATSKQPLP